MPIGEVYPRPTAESHATPVGDTEAVSGSPRAEISLLNQGNPEPPEGRIPGNRGAMDTSTDDQKVELLAFQSAAHHVASGKQTPFGGRCG